MRTDRLLETLDPEEFNSLVEAYMNRVEPDTMSFEAFDHAVRRLAQEAVTETIELTGEVRGDTIVLDSPETAPVIARGNEIVIGGLRLVIRLRQPEPA
jgi:hypothetical protein